ncbi:unnamed protein product, partial [Ectocarpus fasciculatus]
YPPLVVLPHALAFLVHFHAMVSYVPVSLIGRAAMSFAACRRAGVTTWSTKSSCSRSSPRICLSDRSWRIDAMCALVTHQTMSLAR